MATLDQILHNDAMEFGAEAGRRRGKDEKDKRRLEEELAKTKASLNENELAFQRSLKFQPRIENDPQCPRCFVAIAVSFNLTPETGTARVDKWECKNCGYSTEVEIG